MREIITSVLDHLSVGRRPQFHPVPGNFWIFVFALCLTQYVAERVQLLAEGSPPGIMPTDLQQHQLLALHAIDMASKRAADQARWLIPIGLGIKFRRAPALMKLQPVPVFFRFGFGGFAPSLSSATPKALAIAFRTATENTLGPCSSIRSPTCNGLYSG